MTNRELADHGLLLVVGIGTIALIWKVIEKGGDGYDLAAFLLILQRIIEAIKDRWNARQVERMGDQLGSSLPSKSSGGQQPG